MIIKKDRTLDAADPFFRDALLIIMEKPLKNHLKFTI